MTAKEMQIRYWENELRDAERGIELGPEGSEQWAICQMRYGNAQKKLEELRKV